MLKIISFISASSLAIPFLILIILAKKIILKKEVWIFSVFIIVSVFFELMIDYQALSRNPNYFLSNLFSIVEGGLVLSMFTCWFQNKRIKIPAGLLTGVFILGCAYILHFQAVQHLNVSALIFELTLLLLFATVSLFQEFNSVEPLELNPKFWISSGVFIYSLLSVSLFSSTKFLLQPGHWFIPYFVYLHSIANIITNILYSFAFLCQLPRFQTNRL